MLILVFLQTVGDWRVETTTLFICPAPQCGAVFPGIIDLAFHILVYHAQKISVHHCTTCGRWILAAFLRLHLYRVHSGWFPGNWGSAELRRAITHAVLDPEGAYQVEEVVS